MGVEDKYLKESDIRSYKNVNKVRYKKQNLKMCAMCRFSEDIDYDDEYAYENNMLLCMSQEVLDTLDLPLLVVSDNPDVNNDIYVHKAGVCRFFKKMSGWD